MNLDILILEESKLQNSKGAITVPTNSSVLSISVPDLPASCVSNLFRHVVKSVNPVGFNAQTVN